MDLNSNKKEMFGKESHTHMSYMVFCIYIMYHVYIIYDDIDIHIIYNIMYISHVYIYFKEYPSGEALPC